MDQVIEEALEMEKALQQLLCKLKRQITVAVGNQKPCQGVKMISGAPTCATVNLSALDGGNLAPSTYMQSAQAAAVKRGLEPKQSIQAILDSANEMSEKRSVRFSDRERVTLNNNTLQTLQSFRTVPD